jgi:hypothetical protein
MLYKFVFNLVFIVMIGVCGYYTTLYSKLNENIESLMSVVEKKCGASKHIMEENTA